MKELTYREKAREILYGKKPPPKNDFHPRPDSLNDLTPEEEREHKERNK